VVRAHKTSKEKRIVVAVLGARLMWTQLGSSI